MAGTTLQSLINTSAGYSKDLGLSGGPVYKSYTGKVPTFPSYAPAPSQPDYGAQTSAAAAETAKIQAEIAALRAQQAAAPKLLNFDYTGAQANARNQATAAINPVYQMKINNFLSDARITQQRKTENTNLASTQLDEALKNALEATGITGNRAQQDTTTNLGLLANQQQNQQFDQGTDFDKARLALARGTQDIGGGLGAQAIGEQQQQQNITETRQGQAFDQQRQQQQLNLSRTFEDLGRSNTLAKKATGEAQTANTLDFNRFLQDFSTTEGQYGTQIQHEIDKNAAERQLAILQETPQYYNNILSQFIASLANRGSRAQDIVATKQAYAL